MQEVVATYDGDYCRFITKILGKTTYLPYYQIPFVKNCLEFHTCTFLTTTRQSVAVQRDGASQLPKKYPS